MLGQLKSKTPPPGDFPEIIPPAVLCITFKIFLTAYQSSFTRGAYLTARAFSFAVGVSRWEIGPTEADGLPMQLPTVWGPTMCFQLSLILKLETHGTSRTYTFENYSLVCDFGTILRFSCTNEDFFFKDFHVKLKVIFKFFT